jgi:cold-inducible RNA-binding protein
MSNSKLYVGNLSFKTTEDELRSAFGQFGSVTDVYVAMDKMTGRPRGFAFVTMGTDDEAKAAAEKLNGTDLGGRQLTVNEARPKEERPSGGFGGGGGGRWLRRRRRWSRRLRRWPWRRSRRAPLLIRSF